jgi:hypothetical protein
LTWLQIENVVDHLQKKSCQIFVNVNSQIKSFIIDGAKQNLVAEKKPVEKEGPPTEQKFNTGKSI